MGQARQLRPAFHIAALVLFILAAVSVWTSFDVAPLGLVAAGLACAVAAQVG
jgi:hypothetical protein